MAAGDMESLQVILGGFPCAIRFAAGSLTPDTQDEDLHKEVATITKNGVGQLNEILKTSFGYVRAGITRDWL